jgi:hypothetical protein
VRRRGFEAVLIGWDFEGLMGSLDDERMSEEEMVGRGFKTMMVSVGS